MLAVCVLAALLVLLLSRTDPKLRIAIFYRWHVHALTMPVTGVRPGDVRDSWHEGREGGGHHQHEGVDLLAPRGTAVVAAAAGRIWSVGRNSLGGNSISVVGDGWRLYYYAHLDTFAPNLRAGDTVSAGDVLGGVGNSGDAEGGPTHLHFGITELSLFGERPVDPAPLLADALVQPARPILGGVKDPPPNPLHSGGREDYTMP